MAPQPADRAAAASAALRACLGLLVAGGFAAAALTLVAGTFSSDPYLAASPSQSVVNAAAPATGGVPGGAPAGPGSVTAAVAAAASGPDAASGPAVGEGELWRFAEALDAELMSNGPPDSGFDPAFRNPCWKAPSGTLRCLPGGYLMGAFHAGVTSLAAKLSRHKQVLLDHMSHSQFWAEDGKKMRDFVDGFSAASASIQAEGHRSDKVILEVSQSTLTYYPASGGKAHRRFAAAMSPCYRNCSDNAVHVGAEGHMDMDACMGERCFPEAQAADRNVAAQHGMDYLSQQNVPTLMRAVYRSAAPRLVAVLRDPVARLHSAYYGYPHYHGKHGRHAIGFLAYVKEQVSAFRECESSGHTTDECALLFEMLGPVQERVYYHCDQLMRGMYAVYLEGWLRVFPKEALHVVLAEDLFADTRAAVAGITSHLGLTAFTDDEWETARFAGPANSYAGDAEPMLPEAAELLTGLYAPHNERLARLLSDNRFLRWNQRAAARQR